MHSTPFWFATKKEKKKSWIKADKRKRGKKRRSVSWLRADQWGLLDHILVDCILFKETNDGETALSYFYDCVTRFCNLLQHIGLQLHLLHLLLPIQYFFLLCCSCLVSHCNALCSKAQWRNLSFGFTLHWLHCRLHTHTPRNIVHCAPYNALHFGLVVPCLAVVESSHGFAFWAGN